MDVTAFWQSARSRRRIVVIAAFCWPLYGLLCIVAFKSLASTEPSFLLVVVLLLLSWFLLVGWPLHWWLGQLVCPECHLKRPISRNGAWQLRLSCQHCGLRDSAN